MNNPDYDKIEEWKLVNVDATEWKQDDSGIYVLVNWIVDKSSVRLDVMGKNDMPIISFVGAADDVRKETMRWIHKQSRIFYPNAKIQISLEHAAYIGAELEKCDTMRIDYVQDDNSHKLSDNPYDVPASKVLQEHRETDVS